MGGNAAPHHNGNSTTQALRSFTLMRAIGATGIFHARNEGKRITVNCRSCCIRTIEWPHFPQKTLRGFAANRFSS
jgi:hypothetical protein